MPIPPFKYKILKDDQYYFEPENGVSEPSPFTVGYLHHTVVNIADENNDILKVNYTDVDTYPWAKETITRLNSFGYRCDEFKTEHAGKHILFAGCSVTWGDGLHEDEIWAKKVYDKVSKDVECSGYFNISFPGLGIIQIIYMIVDYIKRFGKPDHIFINLPQIYRFYGVRTSVTRDGVELQMCATSDDKTTFPGTEIRQSPLRMNPPTKMLIKYLTISQIGMLEMLCKEAGIDLHMITWDSYGGENTLDELEEYDIKSLHKVADGDIFEKVHMVEVRDGHKDFGLVARDGSHFGEHFHTVWSEYILDKFFGAKR
jgi:hypothetical protein